MIAQSFKCAAIVSTLALSALLAGCASGPVYERTGEYQQATNGQIDGKHFERNIKFNFKYEHFEGRNTLDVKYLPYAFSFVDENGRHVEISWWPNRISKIIFNGDKSNFMSCINCTPGYMLNRYYPLLTIPLEAVNAFLLDPTVNGFKFDEGHINVSKRDADGQVQAIEGVDYIKNEKKKASWKSVYSFTFDPAPAKK